MDWKDYREKYVKEPWNDISERLVTGGTCVLCGNEPAKETAHMPCHKRNSPQKMNKWIDVEENAVPIGFDCKEFSESQAGREIAVAWLRGKFGEDYWNEWYSLLPFKIKDIF